MIQQGRRWLGMALLGVLLTLPATIAGAGTACTQKPLTPEGLANASRLGMKVFKILERSSAQVVILGRVGVDLSKYGLRFSHVGFAIREHPQGRWTVIHLLNQCGTDVSALYDEGLINFFLDDPFAYETLLAVPSPDAQQALVKALHSPLVWRVHQPRYNAIAYPQSQDFQNSNQWLLELMVAALAKGTVNHRNEAQHHPLMQSYQPETLRIDRLTRIGGGLFKANLTFTDHPLADRLKGEYQIVTVRSVIRFLHRSGWLESMQLVDLLNTSVNFTGADIEQALGRL